MDLGLFLGPVVLGGWDGLPRANATPRRTLADNGLYRAGARDPSTDRPYWRVETAHTCPHA